MASVMLTEGAMGRTHLALFYETERDYLGALTSFLREGVVNSEPTMVAVPGPRLDLLRGELDGAAERVAFHDMTEVGRNPARIIPAVRRFVDAHQGRRLRFVGEPIWAGRSAAEIREATRHEALLNTAFAAEPVTILCPYDTAALDKVTLANARRTHAVLVDSEGRRHSPDHVEPSVLLDDDAPPPVPPSHAVSRSFGTGDLVEIRRLVGEFAEQAGLRGPRLADLLLAVNEVATNTLVHAASDGGTLTMWQESGGLVCEVTDGGDPIDPMAGRIVAPADAPGGRGLWLVNQLCDLVEIRSRPRLNIRLHTRLG